MRTAPDQALFASCPMLAPARWRKMVIKGTTIPCARHATQRVLRLFTSSTVRMSPPHGHRRSSLGIRDQHSGRKQKIKAASTRLHAKSGRTGDASKWRSLNSTCVCSRWPQPWRALSPSLLSWTVSLLVSQGSCTAFRVAPQRLECATGADGTHHEECVELLLLSFSSPLGDSLRTV